MNKKTQIFVRVIAIILALLMALGVCLQIVFAEEIDDSETTQPKNTITLQLSNVPDNFPQTEIKGILANVYTKETKIVPFFVTKNWSATLELEDGYYFIYAYDYAWADEAGKKYVINKNEPWNFYVGSDFDATRYPGYSFEIMSNGDSQTVPFALDVEETAPKTIKAHVSTFWNITDFYYPFNKYVYNMEELQQQLLESPLFTGEQSIDELMSGEKKSGEVEIENANNNNSEDDNTIAETDQGQLAEDLVPIEQEPKSKFEEVVDGAKDYVENLEPVTFKSILKTVWNNTRFVFIALIVGVVALIVCKIKKNKQIQKQLEDDIYDEKRIK